MRFQKSITIKKRLIFITDCRRVAVSGIWLALLATAVFSQRVAIVTPAENPLSELAEESLNDLVSTNYKVIDKDLAKAAWQTAKFENPFNLKTEDAKNLGKAIGCDYFLLLKAANARRASLARPEYYEASVAAFLVSSRTGRLIFWTLKNAEADSPTGAEEKFRETFKNLGDEIKEKISSVGSREREEILPGATEIPDESDPAAKDYRAPLPYRRMRPIYTPAANLYGVTATVDALVDVDANGAITRLEIVRWAGYGLDESVSRTIREMQWRAGSYRGKVLPIRVLLRYNFKKIEKED